VRGVTAVLAVATAGAFAGGASAVESTIHPGVGTGRVRLGMTTDWRTAAIPTLQRR
jgi:hypothetical protein